MDAFPAAVLVVAQVWTHGGAVAFVPRASVRIARVEGQLAVAAVLDVGVRSSEDGIWEGCEDEGEGEREEGKW